MGINNLNKILPENLCGVAGLERKTSHSLRVACDYPIPTSDLSEGLGTDDCLPDFYFDVPDEVLSNYPMPLTETVSNINTTLSNCVFNHCVLCV